MLAAFDLFPSLARIAGADLPKGYQGDGEDLSPAILGASDPTRTRPVFWEYGRDGTAFAYPAPKNRSPGLAMLDGDWKILANLDGSGTELYDLAHDPREAVNLATERPEEAARLQDALLRWRKSLP